MELDFKCVKLFRQACSRCEAGDRGARAERAAAAQVDWRAYQETHGLTEKQQKLATKVRKRELRIANLQTEMERIKVPPNCSASPSLHQRADTSSGCLPLPALLANTDVQPS